MVVDAVNPVPVCIYSITVCNGCVQNAGWSSLHFAANNRTGNTTIAVQLLNAGANVNSREVHLLLSSAYVRFAAIYINALYEFRFMDGLRCTTLHGAATQRLSSGCLTLERI